MGGRDLVFAFRQLQARPYFTLAAVSTLALGIGGLARLDAATSLDDLKAIRGNRLESLRGDRAGEDSIRIDDRWRICFRWRDGHAHDAGIGR